MKAVRNVRTVDGPLLVIDPATGGEVRAGGRPSRDALLSAVPVGKVIAGGKIWEGDMQPIDDFLVDAVEALSTPFSSGRTLTAEGPGMRIDPGKVFDAIAARATALAAEYRKRAGATSDRSGGAPNSHPMILKNRLGGSGGKAPPSNAELNKQSAAFWNKPENQGISGRDK